MPKRPGLSEFSTRSTDADRAHEVVALLAGILAGGLDELGAQRVLDVGEPGVVLGERWMVNSLGTIRRPLTSTDRLSSISRISRRPSSIGRMVLLARRENTPSTIRSSRRSRDCMPMLVVEATGVPGWAAAHEALAFRPPLGRVAEWQTRWLQVPVRATSWGFKSPLAHDSVASVPHPRTRPCYPPTIGRSAGHAVGVGPVRDPCVRSGLPLAHFLQRDRRVGGHHGCASWYRLSFSWSGRGDSRCDLDTTLADIGEVRSALRLVERCPWHSWRTQAVYGSLRSAVQSGGIQARRRSARRRWAHRHQSWHRFVVIGLAVMTTIQPDPRGVAAANRSLDRRSSKHREYCWGGS